MLSDDMGQQYWINYYICIFVQLRMPEKQRQTNCRLTFTQHYIPPLQIYKSIIKISFRLFGTQKTQLEILHAYMVMEKNWLSQSQFRELKDLCWALPGPTIIQFIVAMAMLITKSPFVGFMSFIVFSIPSLTVLSVVGWLSSEYLAPDIHLPTQVTLLHLGFLSSSAAIMTHSFIANFQQIYLNAAQLIITSSTAIIFLKFQSINSISFCLIAGAIISLYMQIQTKKKMSPKSENLMKDSQFNWFFGRNALYLLIAIYCILWVWFQVFPSSHYVFIFVFYFVGCFIIGPINTIFAYFYANFIQLNLISVRQFWIVVPFAFLLPGSMINLGIYFGALIDGLRGTILSALFLYLPCFLSLCGILPQWRYYRNKPGIQRLITGINCVTTGLTLSMIILALQYAFSIDVSITICIYIVSIFLNQVWGVYTFIIILLGGFLANMRRWGLIYYRFAPDRQYP